MHLWFIEREGVAELPYARIVEIWRANMNGDVDGQQAATVDGRGDRASETGRGRAQQFAWYNLSGQFCVESFGLSAPGMPQTAAEMGLIIHEMPCSENPPGARSGRA